MVRLEKEIAVIGVISELLHEPQTWQGMELPDVQNCCLPLNVATVFEYSRQLETRSGHAIINGFSGSTLNQFFLEYDQLFQYDPYQSMQKDDRIYQVRLDTLLPAFAKVETNFAELASEQINTLVGRLFQVLEPSLNYPFDLLQEMHLLDTLIGMSMDE